MRTRYAPTPSGYLHLGNLVNFAITAHVAATVGADIALRIDDIDVRRTRPEFVADIFDALAWLDLPWKIGPRNVAELSTWSQGARHELYVSARDALRDAGAVYACSCSRSDWVNYEGPDCPGECARKDVPFVPGVTSLRLDYPGLRQTTVWRRDDVPAYHLSSVVDDDELGVDIVVRGEDLVPSTHVQKLLSEYLPNNSFKDVVVIHHKLVTDAAGGKLSNSAGHGAVPLPRTAQSRELIQAAVQQILAITPDLQPQSRGS